MPVIFAAHGAPLLLDDDVWMSELAAWVREFDAWASESLLRFDVDALKDFKHRAPAAGLALPTWEHYAPVLVCAGASAESATRPKVTFPITGFWLEGAFTKRSVQID